MKIVKLHGGIGNQMFQYAFGVVLKHFTGEIVKFDINSYKDNRKRRIMINWFDIDFNIAKEEEITSLKGNHYNIKKKIELLFNIKIQKHILFEKNEQKLSFKDLKGYKYFDGYWQNPILFKKFENEIKDIFKPKIKFSESYKRYINIIKKNRVVSLHVRRGDYVTEYKTSIVHGFIGLDYYKKAYNIIKSKTDKNLFLIFSDDIEWCKKNLDFIDKKIFVKDINNEIEELELMKYCDMNVIANSTFSWWGAYLNYKNNIPIMPKQWFIDKNKNSNLFVKNWIVI